MENPLIFHASDIDEMAAAFEGWQMDVIQYETGAFQGKLHGYSQLEGRINFYSAFIDKRVFANGHHIKGSVMFTFIACPVKCIWNGEEVHPLTLFVTDAERGLDVDAGSGFISYSVSIDRVLLEDWLRREGIVIPCNWNFCIDYRRNKNPGTAHNFRNLIYKAVYLGDFDLLDFKLGLFRLWEADLHHSRKHLAVNYVPIHETVEMIHEAIRAGRDIPLDKVLEHYGGPIRTFYYNFKRYTGCSPNQYIKNLKLAYVQKLLKMARPDCSEVRSIAYQFGFRHLGQFSSDYKKLFGEVPSNTLKRTIISGL
ncbi:MAG: helix-turn-helix domain-containing protein [Robiginitalea sp.]|nr:helix-turn-helix domain-containing protein [Robiginitalea sp.]